MTREEFEQEIARIVEERMGDDYCILLKTFIKNNDTRLTGLLIHERHSEASPTIYLDGFYRENLEDYELGDIAERIIACYKENRINDIDMSFYGSFEKVKDRICYKLISKDKNETLLEQIPHIPFLDLVICFYYDFDHEKLPGNCSILIRNEHMQKWNASTKELLQLASINTPRLFPVYMASVHDIAMEYAMKNGIDIGDSQGRQDMYVFTNQAQVNGAIALFYPGQMENMYDIIGGDFYILPSSVHEVIVLRKVSGMNANSLIEMVKTVNATEVLEEEVLSNAVYLYQGETGKISMLFSTEYVEE